MADGDGRPPEDPSLRKGIECDSRACVVHDARGRSISYARDRVAIIEDCRRADLVVTNIPWSAPCEARLVDRMALTRDGATSFYSTVGGWSSRSSETGSGERPWSRPRPPPPERTRPNRPQEPEADSSDSERL